MLLFIYFNFLSPIPLSAIIPQTIIFVEGGFTETVTFEEYIPPPPER